MCHATGLVFTAPYTSAPSFWGIYRREAVDRLSAIRYRAGMDHATLAELALYGEIRHVAEPLFWRRGGGKPVLQIARAMTEQGGRGVPLDDILGEQRWRTPLITTAYTHMEAFVCAPVSLPQRQELLRSVPIIFRARWLPLMKREASQLRAVLPEFLHHIATAEPVVSAWLARTVTEVLIGAQTMLPAEDFAQELLEVAAVHGEVARLTATHLASQTS
jgi:hypothetical protein